MEQSAKVTAGLLVLRHPTLSHFSLDWHVMCVHSSAINTHCLLISNLALNTDLGVLARMSSQPQKDSEALDNLSEDPLSPEMLQEMLWLFRREDRKSFQGVNCRICLD